MQPLNRRQWLQRSALLAAGLSQLHQLRAETARQIHQFEREFDPLSRLPKGQRLRLAFNENPHGMSAKAKQALLSAAETGNRYDMMGGYELKQLIARQEGVKPENILLGAGSSELLVASAVYFTGRSGLAANPRLLTCRPTYDDLLECVSAFGTEIVTVPLTKEYRFDLDAMKSRLAATPGVNLVYVCNPNNPTGTVLPPGDLAAFCREASAKAPVFVDEAYIDFLKPEDRPALPKLIAEGHNVLVARTFSKIHGMAGLRLGYLIGPKKTVEEMQHYSRGEWNPSVTTLRAGIASYQDTDWQAFCRTENAKAADVLYKGLKEMSYEYVPTSANFVLFPIRMKTRSFENQMMMNGVMVTTREASGQPYCRISLGTVAEMEGFVGAFKKVVG